MREEFGGSAGLSVLSLWLVPWQNQVLLELASEISLAINRRVVLYVRIYPLQIENSEIESEGRVLTNYWPIGALSMACTLADASSS